MQAVYSALVTHTDEELQNFHFCDLEEPMESPDDHCHCIDSDKQKAAAIAAVAHKPFALGGTRRLVEGICRHMRTFIFGKGKGRPAGQKAQQTLEAFFCAESGLADVLGRVLWRGRCEDDSHLLDCLRALKEFFGWFPGTEPTLEAAALWIYTHGSLRRLPMSWSGRVSEGDVCLTPSSVGCWYYISDYYRRMTTICIAYRCTGTLTPCLTAGKVQ